MQAQKTAWGVTPAKNKNAEIVTPKTHKQEGKNDPFLFYFFNDKDKIYFTLIDG